MTFFLWHMRDNSHVRYHTHVLLAYKVLHFCVKTTKHDATCLWCLCWMKKTMHLLTFFGIIELLGFETTVRVSKFIGIIVKISFFFFKPTVCYTKCFFFHGMLSVLVQITRTTVFLSHCIFKCCLFSVLWQKHPIKNVNQSSLK